MHNRDLGGGGCPRSVDRNARVREPAVVHRGEFRVQICRCPGIPQRSVVPQ